MSQTWLFSIPQIITIGFYIAALVYAGSRPADGSAAKRWAMVALVLFIMTSLSNLVVPTVLARVFSPSELSVYFAIYGMFTSLMYMTGLSFLIAAVFTGRQSLNRGPTAETGGAGVSDNNPYSATSR